MGETEAAVIPNDEGQFASHHGDHYAWLMEQSARLRGLRLPGVDAENLAEEIESLGRRDRIGLESRTIVLLVHLLKWKYQPSHRSRSWSDTIREQRTQIELRLIKSPSLRQFLPSILIEEYSYSIKRTVSETGLAEDIFPPTCEWGVGEVFAPDFLPEG